ncbi:hypothetical protein, partial [Klebsiella pneumoniae]
LIMVAKGAGLRLFLRNKRSPAPLATSALYFFFSPNVNTWVDFIILSIFVVVSAGFMPYIQR